MFESALIENRRQQGALSFSGSLAVQCTVVCSVALISLWAPIIMPEPPEMLVSIPVPRFRNVVQVHSTSVERTTSAPVERRRFQYVPPTASSLQNALQAEAMAEGLPNIASDLSSLGGVTGVPFVPNAIPAPPPQPAPPKPKPAAEPQHDSRWAVMCLPQRYCTAQTRCIQSLQAGPEFKAWCNSTGS